MSGVRWDMLANGPDYFGSVMRGWELGMKHRAEMETRRALAALQGGDNPEALQALYRWNPQLAMQMEDQLYQRGERDRATRSRQAQAAMLLGGPSNALLPGTVANPSQPTPDISSGAQPVPSGGNAAGDDLVDYVGKLAQWADTPEKWDQAVDWFVANGQRWAAQFKGKFSPQARKHLMDRAGYSDAERAAIEADPEAFLTFQGKRLDVTGKQLKNLVDLNNAGMQILGSVHDQATYDGAKQEALRLYSSFGHDASDFIGGLPAEYSPETVRMLQLRGMDTSKQLAAIARENNIESQIEVREQRADEYERHNRAMEGNARRGQDLTDRRVRRGQDITDRRVRESASFKGRPRSGSPRGDLIGPVYQRGGKRIQYSKKAGGYVDLATGQKVR